MNVFFRGVTASIANLEYMGYKVAGSLNGSEKDLNIVRKLISFITPCCKTISCFNGEGVGFSAIAASLFVKKGEKVILMDLTFLNAHHSSSRDDNNLKNYLENTQKPLKFHRLSSGYDYLYGGAYTEFGIELIQKHEFLNLIEALKKQYDRIIFSIPLKVTRFEADLLRDLAEVNILGLKEEKLHDLKNFLASDEKEKLKNLFVFS